MKALALRIAIPALLCAAALAGASSRADAQVVAKKARTARKIGGYTFVNLTVIKGTVAGPADEAWGLSGWKCSDMTVVATSKEHTQPPPNPPPDSLFISQPKWIRFGVASGTWPTCSYGLAVPPNSKFSLSADTAPNADYPCTNIRLESAGTGGYQSVPKGQTKTQNFKVTSISCEVYG